MEISRFLSTLLLCGGSVVWILFKVQVCVLVGSRIDLSCCSWSKRLLSWEDCENLNI